MHDQRTMRVRCATGVVSLARLGAWNAGLALLVVLALAGCVRRGPDRVLRVCADPNDLPFSDRSGLGFENQLAELLAAELGARVQYTWWPQRRSFFRETLDARRCDVVMGVPTGFERVLTTRPYYRSAYVFVTRVERKLDVRSLDDPRLRTLRVGVQFLGDEGARRPAAHELARRGLINAVTGYTVSSDATEPSPAASIVRAVAHGELDVGLVWGPLAASAAAAAGLTLAVIEPAPTDQFFVFDISVGVRKGEAALLAALQRALDHRHRDIEALLLSYGVPLMGRPQQEASR